MRLLLQNINHGHNSSRLLYNLDTTDTTGKWKRGQKHVLRMEELWLGNDGIYYCIVKSDKGKVYTGQVKLTIIPG